MKTLVVKVAATIAQIPVAPLVYTLVAEVVMIYAGTVVMMVVAHLVAAFA